MRVLLCLALLAACTKKTDEPAASRKPGAAPATAAAADGWFEVDPTKPLADQMASAAGSAVKAGKKPFSYLHADWCEPCVAIQKTKNDPKMKAAFAGTQIIAIDVDKVDEKQITGAGMKITAIPAFFKLDEAGKVTGAKIDGGAWGENVPDNMAPPLGAFFAK